METYKILRFNFGGATIKIKTGLSLEEAQAWCSRKNTHKKDNNGNVIWFDGYIKE